MPKTTSQRDGGCQRDSFCGMFSSACNSFLLAVPYWLHDLFAGVFSWLLFTFEHFSVMMWNFCNAVLAKRRRLLSNFSGHESGHCELCSHSLWGGKHTCAIFICKTVVATRGVAEESEIVLWWEESYDIAEEGTAPVSMKFHWSHSLLLNFIIRWSYTE